jgi:hypothetical protein
MTVGELSCSARSVQVAFATVMMDGAASTVSGKPVNIGKPCLSGLLVHQF